MTTPSPARRVAYEVLRRVFEHEAWADRTLPAAAERHGLNGRERAQAQWLTFGAVQRRGTSDHFIEQLADRAPGRLDPPVLAALRLGLFELLWSDGTPDHAAVSQAVELAKAGGGKRRGAGATLVNAVLRRAARERADLLGGLGDATPEGAAIAHSCPEWLARMWWEELGAEGARSLMAAMNEPPETAFRVNTLRAGAESTLTELTAAGEAVEHPDGPEPLAPPEALVARGAIGGPLRERLDAGDLIAQSRASQAVVGLLGPKPGERVLDLCAGPGIKTTAMAARMSCEGRIVAVEVDAGRAGQLRELCERHGASACVEVREADAASDDAGGDYDRVLVDPPCSDLGTLASRPDLRWRKSPETVERVAEVQAAILARGAAALRPGGTLVYSTCTISRRENEDVVASQLERDPGLSADAVGAEWPSLASGHDPRFLQTRPDRDGTDGFFVARVVRTEG